ncbi:MAG: IclR family transcriptional regulator [Solirubrobacterales bacterium]
MAQDREANVAVLGKAMAVLDLLAEAGEASATEIAARLDEPRSSIYRLLGSLNALELTEEGSSPGAYRTGFALLRLGSALLSRLELLRVAQPLLERLHDETGETVYLCLRRDRRAVFISRIDGRQAADVAVAPGDSLPLHVGAAPRALLAFSPRSEWDAYVAGGEVVDYLSGATVTPAELFGRLEKACRDGIVVSDNEVTPGFATLGAPILDHNGQVCGAISVSGPREMVVGEQRALLGERLLVKAEEISRELGHAPGASLNGC